MDKDDKGVKPEKFTKDRANVQGEIQRTGMAMAASETVFRYGNANAEFIKGYSGIDNETGQRMAKGLADIAKHKVNSDPTYAKQNIKQQAGYSAEVATTSRDNAQAIIDRSSTRTWRSDDLAEYGRNHSVVDRVQVLNGEIIAGTESQMKFVGNRDQLLDDIAKEHGKFARYRGVNLELPSEQFEGAKEHCLEKAKALRKQAQKVEELGKRDVARDLRTQADNYEQLSKNVRDSGLTTEQAIFYRKHPGLATAWDITRTSHGAGTEAAKFGAVIAGTISVLRHSCSFVQGEKDFQEIAVMVVTDTAKATAFSYATGFAGSALKGAMQQSTNNTVRTLSATNAPAMAVNICISLAGSVKRYVKGEISEAQLLIEVGEKGSGMLTGAMMAAVGQAVIPIPVVGAAIGGMIGYTMSSIFYQSALEAAQGAELSGKVLERMTAIQTAAREQLRLEQQELDAFLAVELPELRSATKDLQFVLDNEGLLGSGDFASAINNFANLLGKHLQFNNLHEFEDFMQGSNSLKL